MKFPQICLGGSKLQGQYGCINFHAKRNGGQGAKLTVAVKNKWARGWTWAWFYCKVPLLRSPNLVPGKGIFVLHSDMSALDFAMEPSFECANDNASDVTFVNATCSIGSRDAVEEYLACGLLPLSTSVKNNTTSV
jgi:hypothetical protein